MNKRVNTTLARQRRLFGVDETERRLADIITLIVRLASVGKVTEGDVHLARLKVWLLEYTETQRSDFELGSSEPEVY